MADRTRIVPGSVPGNFFVDTTCINCDNCRILAPETFGFAGDYAGVKRQPQTDEEVRRALLALIACPTGSIGTLERSNIKEAMSGFPMCMEEPVYYLGFNSPKSYGGKAYIFLSEEGNWLVDAPKYHPHLVSWIEAHGGLKYIFLTHRDDCADARKYAERFSARRIIHRADLEAQPDAEVVLDGFEARAMAGDVTIIPTPGHTEGHCMLLFQNKFLFSGDVFTNSRYHLDGLEPYDAHWCWYSWEEQTRSLAKLLDYRFEWVLPSHGRFTHVDAAEMRRQLLRAIEWSGKADPEPLTAKRLENLEMYARSLRDTDQPVKAAEFEARVEAFKRRLQGA